MVSVKIYKPAKSAMSSGRGKTKKWVMIFDRENAQYIEPVMQWTGTTSTLPEVKLTFQSQDEAIDFAKKHNWEYTLIQPHEKVIKPKSYVDNFTGNIRK